MQQQQTRAEDLRQANAPRSPSPIKPSQQEQEVLSSSIFSSPHSILPSGPPGLPFPPPFYHPLMANPLYRLSPLLAQLNPLLLFKHNKSQMELVESQIKSQMEVVEEHRKLLLSFGISSGGKASSEEEEKNDDWKDVESEPDVKVEVDDDDDEDIEEEDHHRHQEGNDEHDNDPVDLTFKLSDEEGLAA